MSCSRSIACTAVVGILEGGVGERALGDVDEETDAVGDVLIERRLQADDQRPAHRVLVHGSGCSVDSEEGAAGGHELAEGRNELEQAVRTSPFLDELLVADPCDHARLGRAHDRNTVRFRLERRPLVRVTAIEKRPRLVTDELDQRRDAERLADVVDVDHEHGDADENEE